MNCSGKSLGICLSICFCQLDLHHGHKAYALPILTNGQLLIKESGDHKFYKYSSCYGKLST